MSAAVSIGGFFVPAAVSAPEQDEVGAALFTRLPADECGIDFVNPEVADHPRKQLYAYGYACGGVSLGDLDGDGRLDVFCVSGPADNALYLQSAEKPFTFARAESAGVEGGEAWGNGAALVDIDADGDLDIYVCNYDSPNQLFLNESTPGQPVFTEAAERFGLALVDASMMATFADVDNDGDLDAYVLCNRYYHPDGVPEGNLARKDPETGRAAISPEFEHYYRVRSIGYGQHMIDPCGRSDYLLLNEGAGDSGQVRFRDVSASAGILPEGDGLSATWLDYDSDGLIDLYVANDFESPDRFYRNRGSGADGIPRFEEVTADAMPYTTWSSMGADVGDLNNDGLLDLMVLDMAATTHFKAKVTMGEMSGYRRFVLENDWPRQVMRNMLFLNTGMGAFQESAFMSGVASSDWSWAAKVADYDLDGYEDVLITNGMSRYFHHSDKPHQIEKGMTVWDHFAGDEPLREKNLAFRNRGDLTFENASKGWGFDLLSVSYSAAYGDIDNDGDLDVVVSNFGEPVTTYRNEASGNWLSIRLKGDKSNPRGVGAVVKVISDAHGTMTRLQNPWTGWNSTNGDDLLFGLGDKDAVDAIEIIWPGNRVQRMGGVAANTRLVVDVGDATESAAPAGATAFVPAGPKTGPRFTHQENALDEFKDQPLLPGELSKFGPCMAWGDPNNDGRLDAFFGGAMGQPGEIWLNGWDGRFHRIEVPALRHHAGCEDAAAAWFDADGDGLHDLLVASGSVEHKPGHRNLRNRLYLNRGTDEEGNPVFLAAGEETLGKAAHSSSTVAVCDFDHDGDLDVYIGSRSVAGQYPLVPRGQLLRNESKPGAPRFVEEPASVAPGLNAAGLVTGAEWADLDGDGWEDLAVALEWGPVRVWRNQGGKLKDVTKEAGLGKGKGWWNGVRAGDFDGDGDTDLLALNVGLNTKYGRVSNGKPALLYYGDMDKSGKKNLIEAKISSGKLLPVRGYSCSSNAMPTLKQKFTTYNSFARSGLSDIYPADCLISAKRLTATIFETGIWVNESEEGKLAFTFKPLPVEAQISACYGAAVADFNGDGHLDVFLAQNHFHREPETGLWRGGVGQLLHGAEGGGWIVVPPAESGIVVRDAATAAGAVDIDDDGDPDIIAAVNDGPVSIFLNMANGTTRR